jgi:hypothetical protein
MSFAKALVIEPRDETFASGMKRRKTIKWSKKIRCGTG